MDISVTRFRAQCLEWIRQVESGGEVVEITRHGKPVARLTPPAAGISPSQRPWEKLRLATHDRAIQASGVIPVWEGAA